MADSEQVPLAIAVTVEAGAWPAASELEALALRVASAVFAELRLPSSPDTELSVVFTDDAAIRSLNAQWRAKDKPTNVLSFPAMPLGPASALPPMLGDVVLAAETLRREAAEEGKPFANHLAHLLAHGLLHLLEYDHENDEEAGVMENAERRVLARLAIPDPYA